MSGLYREHRIRTSLARHVGVSPTSDVELRALAARAWRERGTAVFTASDLAAMPAMVRALIESEAKRLHGTQKGGNVTTFNELLSIWYDGEIASLYGGANDCGDGLLMLGCPVWGRGYVERLLAFCLPTVASGPNLEALAGRSRLVLFVDPVHLADLAREIKGLEHKGIQLRLRPIPDEIMKAWNDCPKDKRSTWTYQMLGTAQDILVQTAGRQRMAYHMLMPDHSYWMRFFPNLLRLGERHQAIANVSLCAEIAPAARQLEAFRKPDGGLEVPDREMGNIAFRNLHPRLRPFLMNEASIPDRMPGSHFLFWQGRDKVYLTSCHMNATYLSANLCARAPRFMPATMDACLPALHAGGGCYIPKAEDGLTFLELSDEDKKPNGGVVSFDDFAMTAWSQARFRDDYLWFTRQRCEIPIKPTTGFLTDAQIEAQHADVIDRLVASKGTGAALGFVQSIWRKE